MCIVLFQWQPASDTPLILAANRDEFYARPAEAARWRGHIYCGIDKQAGGTWFGVTHNGRFAAVTNFRESLSAPEEHLKSRGQLPLNYLNRDITPQAYAEQIRREQDDYGPFNLLVGDTKSLWYVGNRGAEPQEVPPGLHGLSNALLNTPWPKIERGKALLKTAIQNGATRKQLLNVLQDRHQPPKAELPQTGVPQALEEIVAPIFIESPNYGTRCSSLLTIDKDGTPAVSEYTWH